MKASDFRCTPEPSTAPEVELVPVARISLHEHNPRGEFDRDSVKELAASIDRLKKLIHPICLQRKAKNSFVVISGARRFAAVCQLGWSKIPAFVEELDDNDALRMMIEENCHRRDLKEVGRMKAATICWEIIKPREPQELIAKRIGVKKANSVSNLLRVWRVVKQDKWWLVAIQGGVVPESSVRELRQKFRELGEKLPIEVPAIVAGMKDAIKRAGDGGLTKKQFTATLKSCVATFVAAERGDDGNEQDGSVGAMQWRVNGNLVSVTGHQRRLLETVRADGQNTCEISTVVTTLWPTERRTSATLKRLRQLRSDVNGLIGRHGARIESRRGSDALYYVSNSPSAS
jgi:ParB/RepB/Spo0J family partition protein